MMFLSKLKSHLMIVIVKSCLLISVVSCRNKIGSFEICVSLEQPGFYCANQEIPSQKNGFDKAYKPNMICMEPNEYNKIIDEISKRDSGLAQYKWGKR